MNIDGREKDTYTRRWRRLIDDRRGRIINTLPVAIVAIRPIHTAMLIPTASVLITTIVMFSHTFIVIFAEGRRHVYTADH
jgi:hypothetical protein